MSTTYTLEYFRDQCAEFFHLCGERRFWALPEGWREKHVVGLCDVYMHTPNADPVMLEGVLGNYWRRASWMSESDATRPPAPGADR